MIKFLLLPCNTTSACEISSSGTYVAGTVTKGLPDDVPPIITPVLREPLPCPLEPPERPVVRINLALERANCLDDAGAGFLVLPVGFEPVPPAFPLKFKKCKYT